jgi:uncharacterized protein YigE (DUF2233 family)
MRTTKTPHSNDNLLNFKKQGIYFVNKGKAGISRLNKFTTKQTG